MFQPLFFTRPCYFVPPRQAAAEASEEVLQLRSKAMVLQQELDKFQTQAQAYQHQLQVGGVGRLSSNARGELGLR